MNVGALSVALEVSETLLISFHSFPEFFSAAVISIVLFSGSLICSSSPVIHLLIPISILSIPVIVLVVNVCSLVLLGPC